MFLCMLSHTHLIWKQDQPLPTAQKPPIRTVSRWLCCFIMRLCCPISFSLPAVLCIRLSTIYNYSAYTAEIEYVTATVWDFLVSGAHIAGVISVVRSLYTVRIEDRYEGIHSRVFVVCFHHALFIKGEL